MSARVFLDSEPPSRKGKAGGCELERPRCPWKSAAPSGTGRSSSRTAPPQRLGHSAAVTPVTPLFFEPLRFSIF